MSLSIESVELILWAFASPKSELRTVPTSHAGQVPEIRAWAQGLMMAARADAEKKPEPKPKGKKG